MARKKITPKNIAEEGSISPTKSKERSPKISKDDLNRFVDNASKSNEIEIGEAVGIIEGLLALLKSSKSKDPDPKATREAGPMPCFKDCEERYEKLSELNQAKSMKSFLKWGIRLGATALIGILGLFFKYYSNPLDPITERLSTQEELIRENRKILYLMGKSDGWEIDPNGKGYKTPWEVKLNGTGKPSGTNGTGNKNTPTNTTP